MTFHSILFATIDNGANKEATETPVYFVDLNLDQVVDAIVAGKPEYKLKPFFYRPLQDVDAVEYRQEIMRDLENDALLGAINAFAQKMRDMRAQLTQADKLYYKHEKESWFLDAVEIYYAAVSRLVEDLYRVDLKSRGLLAFREYLTDYAQSDRFNALVSETKNLKTDLSMVQYYVLIKGDRVTVRNYESAMDYSAQVEKTFAKFKQGAVKDYRAKFSSWPELNHIEARILDFVAQLYPEVFSSLDAYCAKNRDYLDDTVRVFDREVQFYVAYLEHIARFRRSGLQFCYPQISAERKEVHDYDGFDLALANKLTKENSPVVCNDFYLEGKERVLVISGPNQGGKTTFARTFGQLHYLASIGCPVPGRDARLFLFDQLLTHFEKEEDIQNLRGKLEDDLIRMRYIIDRARPKSIVIINEIFTSTTSRDASFLSKKIMKKIIQLDLLCVCVTFIDELASLSEKTVSMVSVVVPENPALRTFKIVRKPADGLAYALSVAEKYRLTYHSLKERLNP